jgi:hypothetical protein
MNMTKANKQSRWERAFRKGAFLIFREKHGNRYFNAGSVEEAGKVCLKVLKERHGSWWENDEECEVFIPSLTRDQVIELPDGRVKDAAVTEWKEWEKVSKLGQVHKLFCDACSAALKNKDGEAAIELLFSRRDYEYENVEITYFEKV